jgi:hypothetical protein
MRSKKILVEELLHDVFVYSTYRKRSIFSMVKCVIFDVNGVKYFPKFSLTN